MRDEARRDGLLVGEPAPPQVAGECLAVAGREADAEHLRGGLVEAALVEELPGDDRVGRRELLGVELLGDLVGLDEPPAGGAARADRLVVAVLATQLDADLLGQALDGLGEGQPVDLHEEGDDVAALPAAEAVEELAGRVDVEGRRLLVVEGAQALQRSPAGALERDVLGHHVVDPRLLAHLGDVVVANPACHAGESTGARPPPTPSLHMGTDAAGPVCTATPSGGRGVGRRAEDCHGRDMTQQHGAPESQTLGALVHQLSQQIPDLVRSEIRLAQAEVAQKGKRAGVGIGMFSVAGLLAFLGLGTLVATAVLGWPTSSTRGSQP